MTSSLVGSEMCIRDRETAAWATLTTLSPARTCSPTQYPVLPPHTYRPVSYTHLTLPTICSV
eukprot:4962180-Prorocentrum_lima.AAC.1